MLCFLSVCKQPIKLHLLISCLSEKHTIMWQVLTGTLSAGVWGGAGMRNLDVGSFNKSEIVTAHHNWWSSSFRMCKSQERFFSSFLSNFVIFFLFKVIKHLVGTWIILLGKTTRQHLHVNLYLIFSVSWVFVLLNTVKES